MKTVAPPTATQVLIQTLQAHLQADLEIPIRVQSVLREKRLVVVIEHLPANPVETTQLFEVAETVVRSQPILDSLDQWDEETFTGQVRFYVRIAGRQQPYALHTCQIRYPETGHRSSDPSAALPRSISFPPLVPEAPPVPIHQRQVDIPTKPPVPLAEYDSTSTGGDEDLDSTVDGKHPAPVFSSRATIVILGALAGLIALGVGTYFLSRPCAVGACPRLEKAQTKAKQLSQEIQQAKSAQDLLLIQQQIQNTRKSLQAIPSWSNYADEAAPVLQGYHNQDLVLTQLLKAFERATTAQQRLKPPHSAQEWSEIQHLWQQAIDYLETISETSDAYPLAQEKWVEYQTNLRMVTQFLNREKQGEIHLFRAKQMAQVAEGREALAKTPGNWQQVLATWQIAMKSLEEVPTNTIPRQEADQLKTTYQSRLANAQTRLSREKLMADAHNKAINLAQQADGLGKQGKWSQAVTAWKDAIANAKQVAPDSFYGQQTQSLLKSYQTNLAQAEQQFQSVERLQKLQVELARICQNAALKICTHSVTPDRIAVQLTPDYLRTISETSGIAYYSGDTKTAEQLDKHLQSLQAILIQLSNEAKIPLELYGPTNQLIGRHIPIR